MAEPLQASFGPAGCTLGRSPDCTLVLPDEGRHISRQQARIDVIGGSSTITCVSAANPLIINGRELRDGQSLRLAHGDRIHVAEYELCFEDGAANLSRASSPAAIPGDPFADPVADPFPTGRPLAPTGAIPAGAIPAEFDPFSAALPAATFTTSQAPLRAGIGRDPLGLGLEADPLADLAADKAESIDALFGLENVRDPLGPDSPLGRPAGEPSRRPARTGSVDPGLPIADNAPMLSGSFRLPQAIPPTEFGAPDDPVLSWNNETGVARAAILPPVPPAGPAAIAAVIDHGFDERPADHSPSTPGQAAEGPGTQAELLRALLLGLGLGELPRSRDPAGRAGGIAQPLTPEVMRLLGELLAAASDGTVALLQARGTLKQQLRADITMIGASDNNLLKFVPDGHSALNQLLSPQPVRGFMASPLAMRDAYDDLLAHQIGFVAGMRAALQGLIERFDPAVLEGRLASKAVLDSLVPGARKARLWELFGSLYTEVSREAEDDFDRLFGRAFVKAYEEQIARIATATVQQPVRRDPLDDSGAGAR